MLNNAEKEVIKRAIAVINLGLECYSCSAIEASAIDPDLIQTLLDKYADFYEQNGNDIWDIQESRYFISRGIMVSGQYRKGFKNRRLIMLELFLAANGEV